jgi:hypothetical protein
MTSAVNPSRRYPRGPEYPNEGFIQVAIETHFQGAGFEVQKKKGVQKENGDPDLICRDSRSAQRWVIEAKGETKNIGLDFRTGLGQLMQRMDDESAHYALAVPNLPSFVTQCRFVPQRVRRAMRLHAAALEMLMTLNFQRFEDVSLLAA